MLKQVHVIYRGRVQGVGFRFSARSLAENLDVKGWVSNLPDGTVELVAQQEEPVLHDFLSGLDEQFSGYIAGRDIGWESVDSSLSGFLIH